MRNPEAPFGLELMAERKRRGHLLKSFDPVRFAIPLEQNRALLKALSDRRVLSSIF
jgi:hypothetical protein